MGSDAMDTTGKVGENAPLNLNPYGDFKIMKRRAGTITLLKEDEDKLKAYENKEPRSFISFQARMKSLQTSVAIQHAKKVRENKESLNINGTLRKTYGEKFSRFFPDPVLNTTLTKKDFTLPFLIDVKHINQTLGSQESIGVDTLGCNRTFGNDNKRKAEATIVTASSHGQEPAVKKQIMDVKGNVVVNARAMVSKQVESKSPNMRPARPLLPTLTPASQQMNINITKVQGTIPALTARAAPRQYVPILPKKDITIETVSPQRTLKTYPAANKEPEEEFAPKIVNTIGSVVIMTTNEEESKSNGHSSAAANTRAPPKLVPVRSTPTDIVPAPKKIKTAPAKGSGFLGCKTCGKTFPCNLDNLFRSHMIIQHNKEVTDEEVRDAKINVASWFQCRNCSIMLLNNLQEHHQSCCDTVPFANAFDAIPVTSTSAALSCPICKEVFESRIWLRMHLESEHPEVYKKVILDPFFRCAVCLQFFTDVSKCILHAYECRNMLPSLETAQELAQKNLYCEVCTKKHSKIRETLFCYQVKNLLRCVLCLHVSISRSNFFAHLKTYHGRKNVGISCPFCGNEEERATRQAFDHFIDNHYNVALKRAGEAALIRGRIHLQAQSAAFKSAGLNPLGGAERKPNIQRRAPVLKASSMVQNAIQNGMLPPGMNPNNISTIRIPASQILHLNNSNLLSQNNMPPLAAGSVVRPIIISSKVGTIPQVPVGYTVVPASSLEAFNSSNITLEPVDTPASEDSILGM